MKRPVLSARAAIENQLLHDDFGFLLRKAFRAVSPGEAFQPNWHIDHLAHEMSLVADGTTLRLLINQPPRSMKSFITSVAFPAWLLGRNPAMRIIVVSYSQDLAGDLHRQFRMIVDAPWYRRAFPELAIKKDAGAEFVTSLGGSRYATSVGGTLTGRGADLIVIDDPHNASEIHSEPARRKAVEFYGGTLISRLNDKQRGAIVVVMQRLHEDDLSGHLLEAGGWRHCVLPAIATEDASFVLPHGVYHRRQGELLQPQRENEEALKRIKAAMGSAVFSAQYQQQPIPAEGNFIKRAWFRQYETEPTVLSRHVIQSWDTAMSMGSAADWSVGTTWLIHRSNYYLLDVARGRWEYPQLRRVIVERAARFKPRTILIEEAGSGKSVLQDLLNSRPPGMIRPIGVKPVGDKRDRMGSVSHKIEAGQVLLPREAPWLADFLTEILAFPNGRHDDQVDSASQALSYKLSTYTLENIGETTRGWTVPIGL